MRLREIGKPRAASLPPDNISALGVNKFPVVESNSALAALAAFDDDNATSNVVAVVASKRRKTSLLDMTEESGVTFLSL